MSKKSKMITAFVGFKCHTLLDIKSIYIPIYFNRSEVNSNACIEVVVSLNVIYLNV